MAALENAREAARRSVCQNNMSQVGIAITLYANSWDEWCPPNVNQRYYLVKQFGNVQGLGMLLESRALTFGSLMCPASSFPEYVRREWGPDCITQEGFRDPAIPHVAVCYLYRETTECVDVGGVQSWVRRPISHASAGNALAVEFIHSLSGVFCHEKESVTGAFVLFRSGSVRWVKATPQFTPDVATWPVANNWNEGMDALGQQY